MIFRTVNSILLSKFSTFWGKCAFSASIQFFCKYSLIAFHDPAGSSFQRCVCALEAQALFLWILWITEQLDHVTVVILTVVILISTNSVHLWHTRSNGANILTKNNSNTPRWLERGKTPMLKYWIYLLESF